MRTNVVFAILIGLLGVLGISLATRARQPHPVAAAPSTSSSAAASVTAPPSAPSSAPPPAASGSAGAGTTDKGLGHPLRVVGLGWELVAPMVLANGGLDPTKDSEVGKAGLRVSVAVVSELDGVEKALARGGGDEAGADIAIVPLPSFVSAYERLAALRPVVFFSTAWSRGRDLFTAKQPLDKLPPTGEIGVKGEPASAAMLLALFALDLVGVAPDRVKISDEQKVALSARTRSLLKPGEQRDVVLSTAEASRLSPMVAICSASLVEKHQAELVLWTKAWLEGAQKLHGDPTSSARSIAEAKDAPEPIALLARLGEVAPVGLGENAELMALSGRSAVTVDSLFQRSWRLLRDAKLLAIPAPERAPIATNVVAKLVRLEPGLAKPEPAPSEKKPVGTTKPLLVARVPSSYDADALGAELALLAGVFARAPLRVTVFSADSRDVIAKARDRYGLGESRLGPGKAPARGNAAATVEILAVP